jgi:Arc/MetJ-type ribon-helix-helix transcriptional regulator
VGYSTLHDSGLHQTSLSGTNVQASDLMQGDGCRAKTLKPDQRSQMAVEVLGGVRSAAAAARHEGVSRKFVASQVQIVREAVQNAFLPSAVPVVPETDERVLFTIPVTARLIQRLVLALVLYCHSSFRGVLELLRDVLGIPISLGTIHNITRLAAQRAQQVNERTDLSGIRIGAHDEIFQNGRPVLVGCDVKSTYCYLLSQEQHRDAETWAVRLMELGDRGWKPDATIADGGLGLRAGQQLAVPELPCRGDIFHAICDLTQAVTFLENRAYGAIGVCDQLERRLRKAKHQDQQTTVLDQLIQARQKELDAVSLISNVSLLTSWLRQDVLAIAGPDAKTRRDLFDFLLLELTRLAPQCPHRLDPVIRMLRNHRENLLAFADELDVSLVALASEYHVKVEVVREVLLLLQPRTTKQWQDEAALRCQLGERFYAIQIAVAALADRIVRASSVIENINSRLRSYFFLRRHLGPEYLHLLQFYLNHHRFPRSERPERVGRSPFELLTNQQQPHWLDQLTNSPKHAA